MDIVRGVDIPLILNLLKFDGTYESGASVAYTIYDNTGTEEVAQQNTSYNASFSGYLDTLDVNTTWSSQTEGNFMLTWKISGVSLYPSTITEELTVFPGGEIEPGYSQTESLRIMLAVLAGKSGGGGTNNLSFRDVNDTKDRLTERVTKRGDRSGVTLDGT